MPLDDEAKKLVAGMGVEPIIFELMRLAWLSVPLARNNLGRGPRSRTGTYLRPRQVAYHWPRPRKLWSGYSESNRGHMLPKHELVLPAIARKSGAGDRNRTGVIGLEDRSSTIELHPRGAASGNRNRVCALAKRHSAIELWPLEFGGDEGSRTPTSGLQDQCAPVITTPPNLVPSPAWDSGASRL